MDYINFIIIPLLSIITIVYILIFSKYYKDKSRVIFNNLISASHFRFFSAQELLSSQSKYVPLSLSNKMPNYSAYSKEKKFSLFRATKKNSFNGINFFLNIVNLGYSDNIHYLVLGSAGIGKTTFLINLFSELKKQNSNLPIELIPLRVIDVNTFLNDIKTEKSETILLLDGIDEISTTHSDYLNLILNLTSEFKLVIISSRTELFYENDTTNNIEKNKFSGNKKYKLKKLYIVPFSEKDVTQYLKLSFKTRSDNYFIDNIKSFFYFLFGNPQVNKAKTILSKVKFASLRPLFLYYITDIVNNLDDEKMFDFQIYEILISKWIERESYDVVDKENFSKSFLNTLESITLEIYLNKKNYLEIDELTNLLNNKISNQILDISIKTKSLLIRNDQNRFYFFHTSIFEFILAKMSFDSFIKTNDMNTYPINRELNKHLKDEMLAKYFFIDSNLIDGDVSSSLASNISFLLKDIKSLEEIRQARYLKLIKCNTDLRFLTLMPNLKYFQFKLLNEHQILYLSCLKRLQTLDLTNNKIIKDLSILNTLPQIEIVDISNTTVDINSLIKNNKINKIFIKKNQYSDLILKKFPDKIIRYYMGGFIEISIASKSPINKIIRKLGDMFNI